MAEIVHKLTAQSGGESAAFLNQIVAAMWPNINVAGSQMTKDIADPMFKTMLPGPLSSLHFTKVDLGNVPMAFSNVVVTKTETNGIKLDMNVDWDGKCDIELAGSHIPTLGVKSAQLHGRLSIYLCPLTNIIPLIGAAQVAFVNPPVLNLDFTGAANVADFSMIDGYVRNIILSIINSMATLPNRYLVNLDTTNDYFKTYLYPLGTVRVTIERAWDFAEEAKTATKKFFSKITRASPDCYVKVDVGAEEQFKTKTMSNTTHPTWNETHDFVLTDFDQAIKLDVEDEDVGGDDEVGIAVTTVKDILKAGGRKDLPLVHKGKETDGKVSLTCEYFEFVPEGGSLSAVEHKGEGKLGGLVTILVASAFDVKGKREELKPSVVVTYGSKHKFQTAIKTDYPGTDINNPMFDQNFRVPLTSELLSSGDNFRIVLMDGEKEVGGVDVPFAEVQNAPKMTLEKKFDVGGGATVRASFCLRGVRPGKMPETALPQRPKQ